jgi:GNAT superfamily N-acetyltransferase
VAVVPPRPDNRLAGRPILPTLGQMEVAEIDVHDDDLVRRFWEAGKEADEYERPYATFWPLLSAKVAFRATDNSMEQHPLAAVDDGHVLGSNQVILPVLDNTHVAYMEILVRPAARGRGVGSALLDAGLELARARSRSTVIIEVNMPLAGRSVGRDFLERRGFTTGIVERHRVLDLPLDGHRLDALAASAAQHHADYRLETFGDVVPDAYIEGYCALQSAFNDEAPTGDLDVEPEAWDADRVRKTEARFCQSGRHICSTVAFARDGSMVALTDMSTSESQPTIGFQGGTLVLPEHRGHRLGLAGKVANLRRFQVRFPTVRAVHSWNAEQNGPMVAINDTLGFRAVERLVEMQRRL